MSALLEKLTLEKSLNLAVLILVILIAYQSGNVTLNLMSGVPVTQSIQAPAANQKQSQSSLPSIQSLLAQNIFGEVGSIPEIVEEVNVDAPETKLSLELQGVSVGRKESSSSAIISESKNGEGEIYWIGDSIAGKAILAAVFEDRVVIKQNGNMETLRFSEDFRPSSGAGLITPMAEPVNTSDQADVLRSYRTNRNNKDNMIRELGSALNDVYKGDFESFDRVLDGYGSQLEQNIQRAAQTAGLKDKGDGVEVGNSQQTWMNRVGLEPGDVIKTVNNYPASTLKTDRAAIDSVIKSCLARIEVQRGENTFVVTYPFCR